MHIYKYSLVMVIHNMIVLVSTIIRVMCIPTFTSPSATASSPPSSPSLPCTGPLSLGYRRFLAWSKKFFFSF